MWVVADDLRGVDLQLLSANADSCDDGKDGRKSELHVCDGFIE